MNNGDNYSQQDFERIEKYLLGEMGPEERAGFEQELSNNADLQAALEQTRLLVRGIEYAGMKGMMDDFHNMIPDNAHENRYIQTTFKTMRNKMMPYLIAASVLLLVVLGVWWLTNLQPAHEKLFARHYQPDPGLITPMSSGENYLFYAGMVEYRLGNYDNAIDKWSQVLNQKPLNDTLSYFLGVAFLSVNDLSSATAMLNDAVAHTQSVFIDDAWYYLGLAHLKKGNWEKALAALKESRHENAEKVIRDIKQERQH